MALSVATTRNTPNSCQLPAYIFFIFPFGIIDAIQSQATIKAAQKRNEVSIRNDFLKNIRNNFQLATRRTS